VAYPSRRPDPDRHIRDGLDSGGRGQKWEIKPGDVIWTPPGVKHWHGATATNSMSHIAITNMVDGKNVDWMEQVSDDQYRR
jgi:mannose-6-phosphate isomerase-like protein (cupin superfamily)